jgi:ribosomal protein L7/L12
MKGEYLYNLYRDIIPKQYVFLKYIKSNTKQDYKIEEIEAVQQYFEVSRKEAKEYIDMLPKEELIDITQKINGK